MQRWQYPAAAVALTLASPLVNGEASAPVEIVEDRSVTDDGAYSVTDCGSIPGGLGNDLYATGGITPDEVTARIYRTKEGEAYHGYRVGGIKYGSLDALMTGLEEV